MRHLATALFVVVGLINVFPLVGVLGAQQLNALYALPFDNPDLLLLMRHRAVLFGLVGGLLLVAAFKTRLRPIAATLGLGSMLSFLVLALPLAEHGAAIQRVFWADVVASGMLVLALWLDRRVTP